MKTSNFNNVKSYKNDFEKWVKKQNIKVFNHLSDVCTSAKKINKGDKVTFINDYGIKFPGHQIMGFCVPYYEGGGSVYIDYDCYWFPAKPENLQLEN